MQDSAVVTLSPRSQNVLVPSPVFSELSLHVLTEFVQVPTIQKHDYSELSWRSQAWKYWVGSTLLYLTQTKNHYSFIQVTSIN